jgi:hypothetical protein
MTKDFSGGGLTSSVIALPAGITTAAPATGTTPEGHERGSLHVAFGTMGSGDGGSGVGGFAGPMSVVGQATKEAANPIPNKARLITLEV